MPEINDENVVTTDDTVVEDNATVEPSDKSEPTEKEKELESELGNLKRDFKKLQKEKEKEAVETESKSDKSDELNEGQVALLSFKGYSDSQDIAYIEGEMKESGKSLKEVIEMKYVQEALGDLKKARESQDAGDVKTKRSHSSAKDSVEYHISKGTNVLDIADVELRRKVVKSRIDTEKNVSKFTDNPLIK